jgi:hypothetical protein
VVGLQWSVALVNSGHGSGDSRWWTHGGGRGGLVIDGGGLGVRAGFERTTKMFIFIDILMLILSFIFKKGDKK